MEQVKRARNLVQTLKALTTEAETLLATLLLDGCPKDLRYGPVEALGLGVRLVKSLHAEGVHTVEDLCLRTEEEILLRFVRIGRRGVEEIIEILGSHDLALGAKVSSGT